MQLVVYISDYIESEKNVEEDIQDIVRVAKVKNLQLGITGVLFFHNGKFIQVIEGEEKNIRSLLNIINKDKRHQNLVYLVDTVVQSRGFQDWNMDSFNLSEVESLDEIAFKKVWKIYEANLLPKSDALVKLYKSLMNDKEFQMAIAV